MKALRVYAGPRALAHIERNGIQPSDVAVIPAAAGGPKGLMLGAMDRFLFGDWLLRSNHEVHLVGASIGAWRMAAACLNNPLQAFDRFEHDYVHQHYQLPAGKKRLTPSDISAQFGQNLSAFFSGRVSEVLTHPRFRLHIITARGQGLLAREHPWWTPLGYAAAFATNLVSRKAMGHWLERVVFSTPDSGTSTSGAVALPFSAHDYATRQLPLSEDNFQSVLQASCSIPFVLSSVDSIAGAPPGAYWDGGITDYHLHLPYGVQNAIAASPASSGALDVPGGLVLYPHFHRAVVPGWLDKGLPWRHKASSFLQDTVLLAPDPAWVLQLPEKKLPDRTDFARYGQNLDARAKAWTQAIRMSYQLADELQEWLDRCNRGEKVDIESL